VKLLTDATTPFGRKIAVAAIERQIAMEEVFVPLDGTGPLDEWNPLRQIPTLVLDDGRAIYDSDVITEYLDTLHRGEPLIPASDRFSVLTRMTLGNGLTEATMLRRIETVRVPQEKSPAFITKMEQRIDRSLKALEAQAPRLSHGSSALRADQIAVGCALGYVDFRYVDTWRAQCPRLAEWYASLATRLSFTLTAPTRTAPVGPEHFR
jgi:glutathione S-transferase